MTPLGTLLAARIREEGPIGLDTFMGEALGNPTHGYYRTRDPLGVDGDFTTAPEISQVFGEILGLWCVDAWQRMGSPKEAILVELGPGRGTLMADMLRAMAVHSPCRGAVSVHLVETSPTLRARQAAALASHQVSWHEDLSTLPAGPILLVANEFFDALPIRQWVRRGEHWLERRVGCDESGGLIFVEGPAGHPPDAPGDAAEGEIFETGEAARAVASMIGARLRQNAGAALIVDYGHERTHIGDTLQAVRAHRHVPPLDCPGERDLTAHVDFEALSRTLAAGGAVVEPLTTQGAFLVAHGAALREAALTRGKGEDEATQIRHAIRRLIDPTAMGRLFKVLVARSMSSGARPS